jgi:hypothetical protein
MHRFQSKTAKSGGDGETLKVLLLRYGCRFLKETKQEKPRGFCIPQGFSFLQQVLQ